MFTMVDSCTLALYNVHTYVKGGRGEYTVTVANAVVVHAYNMWEPCTVYVHVYTLFVHVYEMYIHVLISCLNMEGRVPLIPLFLAGNQTPTISHQYRQHKKSGFPVRHSCDTALTAAADGSSGSNVYRVNRWLWQFVRGKPRLGGLSVEKTGARKEAAQKERLLR